MEIKIGEIQPAAAQAWSLPDAKAKENEAIPPVARTEGGSLRGIHEEKADDGSNGAGAPVSPKQLAELTKEMQSFLDDLNISLNFKFEDKSGDMVVQVLNRENGDVIRQIPPESVVRLRERLRELRGSLVDNQV